jgi:AraC-like DNA-binding protein
MGHRTIEPPQHPVPVDADALETVLAAIDVRIRRQLRFRLADGQALPLGKSTLTVAYVIAGEVRTRMSGNAAEDAVAGDVILSSGRRGGALVARGDASVLLSELDLLNAAAHVSALLPETATVHGFAEREPAAAALVAHMGVDAGAQEWTARGGDLAICRMMARTVLASVVRAWAAAGCAPQGWPTAASDPFLDHVVAAIQADPGRDWTVDTLASVGAMSRSVFAERFRSTFGLSPAGYVTAVRMRAAQDLLARGHGVSAVSRELGYNSDEGFSRAFRRSVGTSPSVWRATHALATA